jgi:hypothetical protein
MQAQSLTLAARMAAKPTFAASLSNLAFQAHVTAFLKNEIEMRQSIITKNERRDFPYAATRQAYRNILVEFGSAQASKITYDREIFSHGNGYWNGLTGTKYSKMAGFTGQVSLPPL